MSRIDKDTEQPIEYQKMRPSHLLAFFVLVSTVGLVLTAMYGFYVAHWTNAFARQISTVIPLPAAEVEGEFIAYRDVLDMTTLLSRTGEGDEDPWGSALAYLIDRKHVEQLAHDLGVTVAEKEISEYPVDQSVLEELGQTVGWGETEYRRYVVRPLLYAQRAETAMKESSAYQDQARSEIEGILEKIDAGVAFTDLARQLSEDISASEGGHLGYVTIDDVDPGLEDLFALNAGEISDILETDTYFAIGYVYDVVPGIEVEETQIGLQLITVKKDGLDSALELFAQDREVKIFVR